MSRKHNTLLGISILAIIVVIISGIYISKSKLNYSAMPFEPPEISVTYSDQYIPYVVGKDIWNGEIFNRIDNLQLLMKQTVTEDLIFVPIGKTIQIEFKSNVPNSIKLFDEVTDSSGEAMFKASSQIISIPFNKNKGSFTLDKHMATSLSSNTETFENGVLRGFRLICKWKNENECEYSFIIKTEL